MQNDIRKKVNGFGKIGKIVVTVLLVIVLIGGITASVAAVYLSQLPDDAISVSVSGKANIQVDESLMGILAGRIVDGLSYESDQMPDLSDEADMESILPEDTQVRIDLSINNADYATAVIHSEGNMKSIEAQTDDFVYEIDNIIKVIIGGIVYVAAIAVSLFMLGRLFKEFESCETPFTDIAVKRLYAFGFSLIPVILIGTVAEAMAQALLTPSEGINFYLDVGAIVAFVVTICLCTLFKYGAQLQQESDETL